MCRAAVAELAYQKVLKSLRHIRSYNLLCDHFITSDLAIPHTSGTVAIGLYRYNTVAASDADKLAPSYCVLHARQVPSSQVAEKRKKMFCYPKPTVLLMLGTILLRICSTLSQVTETCSAAPSEPVISYGEQNHAGKGPCAVCR